MSRTTTTLVLLTIAFAFSANSIMAGYGSQQDPIELQLKDADVRSVMRVFAEMTNSELYLDPAVMGTVTIGIEGISWMTALDAVCESVGCLWQLKGGTQRTLTILPGTKASDASGLNSPITITVEGVPILDLIGLVANRSGVSLERIGQPQGEISLAIDGASARTVISAVCESSGGCTWRTTEDGSIEVEATDSPKMTRAQVDAALAEPMNLDLKDADALDVLRTLSTVTQCRIVTHPEVRGTVSFELRDSTTLTVLNEICAQLECLWSIEDSSASGALIRLVPHS